MQSHNLPSYNYLLRIILQWRFGVERDDDARCSVKRTQRIESMQKSWGSEMNCAAIKIAATWCRSKGKERWWKKKEKSERSRAMKYQKIAGTLYKKNTIFSSCCLFFYIFFIHISSPRGYHAFYWSMMNLLNCTQSAELRFYQLTGAYF